MVTRPSLFRRDVSPRRLTSATPAGSVICDGPPLWEVKREAGASSLNSGAAPATVSDEPQAGATGNPPGRRFDGSDPRARRPAITNCALETSSGRGAPDGSESVAMSRRRDPTKLVALWP